MQGQCSIERFTTCTHLNKLSGLDTDREGADVRIAAFELNTVRQRRQAEDTSTGRKEVTSIVVRVEADQVALKDTKQNFTADRKNAG